MKYYLLILFIVAVLFMLCRMVYVAINKKVPTDKHSADEDDEPLVAERPGRTIESLKYIRKPDY